MEQAQEMVERGRRTALVVAGALVAIDLLVMIAWIARFGTDDLPRLLVRLGLTVALAAFLYRGFQWARWVIVALLIATFLFGSWSIPGTREQLARQWPVLLMILAYILIGRTLLYSRSLVAFMRRQRGEPVPDASAA